MTRVLALLLCATLARPTMVAAQSPARMDVGAAATFVRSSQFDDTDVGINGRFAWHPVEPLGIEAELGFYPDTFPGQRAFSRRRIEGLFGLTAGPRLQRVRPFAKIRPGFLRYSEAPEPFPCILIYPPPLNCALASGRTLAALDVGGGVELLAPRAAFARLEIGDLLLKYPGPAIDASRRARQADFFSHNLRVAVGAGLRF